MLSIVNAALQLLKLTQTTNIDAWAEHFCFHRLRQKAGVMTSTGKMRTLGDPFYRKPYERFPYKNTAYAIMTLALKASQLYHNWCKNKELRFKIVMRFFFRLSSSLPSPQKLFDWNTILCSFVFKIAWWTSIYQILLRIFSHVAHNQVIDPHLMSIICAIDLLRSASLRGLRASTLRRNI